MKNTKQRTSFIKLPEAQCISEISSYLKRLPNLYGLTINAQSMALNNWARSIRDNFRDYNLNDLDRAFKLNTQGKLKKTTEQFAEVDLSFCMSVLRNYREFKSREDAKNISQVFQTQKDSKIIKDWQKEVDKDIHHSKFYHKPYCTDSCEIEKLAHIESKGLLRREWYDDTILEEKSLKRLNIMLKNEDWKGWISEKYKKTYLAKFMAEEKYLIYLEKQL